MGTGARDKERVSRHEIEQSGEVWNVRAPVGPTGHISGEGTEGALRPHIHAAFLRKTARQRHYDDSDWNEHCGRTDEPYRKRARSGRCSGCNPLQIGTDDDEEQRHIEQPQTSLEFVHDYTMYVFGGSRIRRIGRSTANGLRSCEVVPSITKSLRMRPRTEANLNAWPAPTAR